MKGNQLLNHGIIYQYVRCFVQICQSPPLQASAARRHAKVSSGRMPAAAVVSVQHLSCLPHSNSNAYLLLDNTYNLASACPCLLLAGERGFPHHACLHQCRQAAMPCAAHAARCDTVTQLLPCLCGCRWPRAQPRPGKRPGAPEAVPQGGVGGARWVSHTSGGRGLLADWRGLGCWATELLVP
jgi:hypothetical protein